jgi:putative membrane protein
MKNFPGSTIGFPRAARLPAAALLSLTLGLLSASAQSSNGTGTDTAGTTGTATGSAGTMKGSSAAGTDSGTYGSTSSSDESSLKHADKRFLSKAAESSQREVALSQLAAQRATNPQVRDFAQQLVSEHTQMDQQLTQLAQQKGVTLPMTEHSSRWGAGSAANAGTSSGSGLGSSTDAARRSSNTADTAGVGAPGRRSSNGATAGTASTMSTDASGDMAATSDRHYRSLSKKSGADFDKEYISLMVDEHKSDVKLFEKAAKDAKDPEIRAFASQHVAALQSHLDHASTLTKSAAE